MLRLPVYSMHKYFEHQADIGIIGIGMSLDTAFEEAAKGLFEVMCEIKNVKAVKSVKIDVHAADEGALLVEWLNELLAQKDIKDMMFSSFSIKITKKGDKFMLSGIAKGEKIQEKHHLKLEVKAATYSQLSVKKEGKCYEVRCVVDV